MMNRSVEHRGIVDSIHGDVVMVKVEKQTACAACHAKGICGEKGEERIIEVHTPRAGEYSHGDRVVVALKRRAMGMMSIVWAYLLPLVVLLVVLFTMHNLGFGDGPAAMSSMIAIVLYYVALYVFRKYIDRKIKFTIIKE